ncbi:conserved hypothetical protein [Cupriavidus oxalaticus]|uniref:DUF2946 domain-containing protein n=1 Tax=Cupriavidus oxalaticus TaxID=96344 RepID=A0A375GHI3_9BURK|nr:conserved hypothetical protein [Cupriavidus oxalaticus]
MVSAFLHGFVRSFSFCWCILVGVPCNCPRSRPSPENALSFVTYATAYATHTSLLRHAVRRHPVFAGLLLVVFLTVQLAAVAYACTGTRYQLEGSGTAAAMTESCADMAPGSDYQGIDQSGLCQAHCQADSKSVDHASAQLPAFLPVLRSIVEPTRVVLADVRVALRAEVEARGPPALNILHCSFQT